MEIFTNVEQEKLRPDTQGMLARLESRVKRKELDLETTKTAVKEMTDACIAATGILSTIDFSTLTAEDFKNISNPWKAHKFERFYADSQIKDALDKYAPRQWDDLSKSLPAKKVRQIWRTEIVSLLIKHLASAKLPNKGGIMLRILEAQPSNESLETSVKNGAGLSNSYYRKTENQKWLIDNMSSGGQGKLNEIISLTDWKVTRMRVVIGGSLVRIPLGLARGFKFNNAFQDADPARIYAQMANGCRGNLVVIDVEPKDASGGTGSAGDSGTGSGDAGAGNRESEREQSYQELGRSFGLIITTYQRTDYKNELASSRTLKAALDNIGKRRLEGFPHRFIIASPGDKDRGIVNAGNEVLFQISLMDTGQVIEQTIVEALNRVIKANLHTLTKKHRIEIKIWENKKNAYKDSVEAANRLDKVLAGTRRQELQEFRDLKVPIVIVPGGGADIVGGSSGGLYMQIGTDASEEDIKRTLIRYFDLIKQRPFRIRKKLEGINKKYGRELLFVWSGDWKGEKNLAQIEENLPKVVSALDKVGKARLAHSPRIVFGEQGRINDSEGLSKAEDGEVVLEIDYDDTDVDEIKEQILDGIKEWGEINPKGKVTELTGENLDRETRRGKVVLDIYAPWCEPCKLIKPKFDQLAGKNEEMKFVRLDGDKYEEAREKYRVKGYPTFIFLLDGKEVGRVEGAKENEIVQKTADLKSMAP